MEWQPWIFTSLLTASLCVSCATQEVDRSMGKHSEHEGRVYSREVMAQSPFKPVKLSWGQARELMKERNPHYRSAALSYNRATTSTSLVKNFSTHMGGSIEDTVKGIVNPKDLAQTFKEPSVGLPKQLSSISSLKDVSHKMAQEEWELKEKEVIAEKKMREQIVDLQLLFRRSAVIEKHMSWVEDAKSEKELDAEAKKELAKFETKLKADRRAWLGEVRDYFNAEYFDVQFVQGDNDMPNYRNIAEPDFAQWQRWGMLSRVESLAGALKKEHEKSKPAIPGTDVLKDKLSMMVNDGDTKLDAELDTQSVRNSVRTLIRSWRGMKVAQNEADVLRREIKPLQSSAGASKTLVSKMSKIYSLELTEVKHAKEVWMMDERCWAD
ncbi:hypothetical protein Rhal01_01800 [Rubritalea halochordaticola]|uniref:Uncharacterized protein n=2 Tax=Rubritalea halochordaticola TaxID=714537 RepID=A0ABP9V3G1_9BACT